MRKIINQYIWSGIWILNSSILTGIIIYLIVFGIIWISNKRRCIQIKQIIPEVALSIYTVALLKITGIIGMKFYFSYVMNGMYNLSLIPFKDVSLMMLVLNFLLFIPYGMLLPCVFKGLSFKRVISIGLLTSISIEVLQLFGGRYAEIDDVLINTLGAFIGFIIYSYAAKNIFKSYNLKKEINSSV